MISPRVTARLIERFTRLPPPRPDDTAPEALSSLTARELDILRALARGMSNAEIAAQFIVSEATVKTHVANLLAKLKLRDRVQAAILAYETGFVTPAQNQ